MRTQGDYQRELDRVIAEVNALHDADDILGIAVAVVRRNQDARTLVVYDQGGKLPLLGVTVLIQQQQAEMAAQRTAHD